MVYAREYRWGCIKVRKKLHGPVHGLHGEAVEGELDVEFGVRDPAAQDGRRGTKAKGSR